jgi:hypothetical protein
MHQATVEAQVILDEDRRKKKEERRKKKEGNRIERFN